MNYPTWKSHHYRLPGQDHLSQGHHRSPLAVTRLPLGTRHGGFDLRHGAGDAGQDPTAILCDHHLGAKPSALSNQLLDQSQGPEDHQGPEDMKLSQVLRSLMIICYGHLRTRIKSSSNKKTCSSLVVTRALNDLKSLCSSRPFLGSVTDSLPCPSVLLGGRAWLDVACEHSSSLLVPWLANGPRSPVLGASAPMRRAESWAAPTSSSMRTPPTEDQKSWSRSSRHDARPTRGEGGHRDDRHKKLRLHVAPGITTIARSSK